MAEKVRAVHWWREIRLLQSNTVSFFTHNSFIMKRKLSWKRCCACVAAGEVCRCLCSGDICGKLCREDGPLHHHRPQCGHDAGPAHQRWQPRGPQGHCNTITLTARSLWYYYVHVMGRCTNTMLHVNRIYDLSILVRTRLLDAVERFNFHSPARSILSNDKISLLFSLS